MRLLVLSLLAALAACKPPPGDAAMERELPVDEPVFASPPLPSPDTQGAIWAPSQQSDRIIYGVPEGPALVALECLDSGTAPRIEITRMAAADEGAEALLALVGNGAIGRIEVDAAEAGSNLQWRGALAPTDRNIEPLLGPRKVTATIPGAGTVELNPSNVPAQFIARCGAALPVLEELQE